MTAVGVGDGMAIRVARTASAAEVTDRPARAYLAALGWMGTRPARTTWADLRRRHGRAVRAVRAAIIARDAGGPGADIYEAKNRSFTLGLDVTLAHMGDLYRAVLEATLPAFARGPAPRAILDLGCDNGVLTCAYALNASKLILRHHAGQDSAS